MPDTLKMGLKLLLITAIATFALALTQMITEEPIRVQAEKANDEARAAVLEGAEEFRSLEISERTYPNILEAHEGLDNGNTIGYTFKTTNSGYGGQIVVIVGIDSEGVISGVRIAQHAETPGLGAKAQESSFYQQYSGKSGSSNLSNDDIQAITGATVSSNAVTGAVNHAIDYYLAELVTGGDNQ
jgi:electron transport complex protein RnfG